MKGIISIDRAVLFKGETIRQVIPGGKQCPEN
jgi:hypothetical protein